MTNPVIAELTTKVFTEAEPLAQLISALFDTLSNPHFDIIPQEARAEAVLYVANVYGRASNE